MVRIVSFRRNSGPKRSAQQGFESSKRSAQQGFTPLERSAQQGFESSKRSAQQGFTLLEMLVALAVFSLAALALVRLQGVTLRTAADLDSKAMGQIVARNLMVEVQTDPLPPSVGEAEGDVDNGGRRWHWTRAVRTTDDQRLLQVDVVVNGQAGASPTMLSFVRVVE